MSPLHIDVDGFSDGVCERVMWGVFSRPNSQPEWLLAELHSDEETASYSRDSYNCQTIIHVVKVRVDLRGAQ